MADVVDVAKYILKCQGEMTAMKLQKLVYYAQAWHLVWEECPLFDDDIQAWVNGPVVPKLYELHRQQFLVSVPEDTQLTGLNEQQKESIDTILKFYGDKSSQWLSDLTHLEDPWIQARQGLAANERGQHIISHRSMAEYYESL